MFAKRRNYLLNELRGLPKIGSYHTRNLSEVDNSFNINKVTLFESKQQQLVDFRRMTNSKVNILFSPKVRELISPEAYSPIIKSIPSHRSSKLHKIQISMNEANEANKLVSGLSPW